MNAVQYIHSLRTFGKKAGLANIEALLNKMGNPHKNMNFVHIAGTNGKGSVSAMLNSILTEKYERVGLFTSPFLEYFNERICVNSVPISDFDLDRITERIKPLVKELEAQGIFCTVFDVTCAVGFAYFKEQRCDAVVLEVGLGGRFDSTNIIEKPACSVICAVGYDHMQYLGSTLAEIAFEKCGIIKKSSDVVAYPLQDTAVRSVIDETCEKMCATLVIPDVSCLKIINCSTDGGEFSYKGEEYKIGLVGKYQIFNALCAIEAANVLKIENTHIKKGLEKARWKCRFEIFKSGHKLIVLDGAHNSHGISAFLRSAEELFAERKVHYVFSILNEKDVETSCNDVANARGNITVTDVPSERCTDEKAVYGLIKKQRDDTVYISDFKEAFFNAVNSDCDVVCVFGSLYTVGALRKTVEIFSQNDKTI